MTQINLVLATLGLFSAGFCARAAIECIDGLGDSKVLGINVFLAVADLAVGLIALNGVVS